VFAATTQFLIVMVAGWLNEGIQKQLEHALLECRVLREVIEHRSSLRFPNS
jgi:hypothetical protein